jgi:hypothetical protein
MTEIIIKPEDLDYTTFALTLGTLKEADQAKAITRVKELLHKNRASPTRSNVAEPDEETAFRVDVAAQVLQELARAGKIKRLVRAEPA